MKKKLAEAPSGYQEKVTGYFQSISSHWNEVYKPVNVYAETLRARQGAVLAWIDSLALAPGSQALDIGCGPGFMAIALARRGLHVQAIDSSEAMIRQAHLNAIESGTAGTIEANVGDVYSLAFDDNSFDLVYAIGLLPWLAQAELAIQELARVTKPGGYVILTAANWKSLPESLDPQLNPSLAPFRRSVKALLKRMGLRVGLPEELPKMVYHRPQFIAEALSRAGLLKMREQTIGFGPFTFLCHTILPSRLGLALHHRLQHLAERNVPVFRSTGMSYHVLAQKPTAR